jgi:hypothetical protein
LASGLPLLGYRSEGTSVYFQIGEPDRAADILSRYVSGRLTVNAKKLLDALNELRDLARAAQAGERR